MFQFMFIWNAAYTTYFNNKNIKNVGMKYLHINFFMTSFIRVQLFSASKHLCEKRETLILSFVGTLSCHWERNEAMCMCSQSLI